MLTTAQQPLHQRSHGDINGVDQQQHIPQQEQQQFVPRQPVFQGQLPIYENNQNQLPRRGVERRQYLPQQPMLGDFIPGHNYLPQRGADQRPYQSRQPTSGGFTNKQRPMVQENGQNSRPYRPFVPRNNGQTYERNSNERPWRRQQQSFVSFNDPYFNGSVNRQGGAVLTPHQRQRRTRLNRARRDREERAANQLSNQVDALPVDNRFACFLDQDENDEIPLDECTAATTSTAKSNKKAVPKKQKNKKAEAQAKKPVSLVSNDDTSALDSEQKPKEYRDRPYPRADHIRWYL
ncbi:unnamed protein product [Didymodactylos carnosus]|uniref:Uncharacterized protein n=1 Tax=Didymodactylos carnosus TaxID=1234261 RepID=A0A815ZSL6_9BILA|nr:unnamed protein product [Didymodactylos carnosus]CAF4459677.1 unnamed protein product [Didymodactylos carnosus]